MRPLVTVAMCLFNSSRFIDETLASVFAQTFDDFDVVLVDDGSTDGCADAIERRYCGRRLTIVRQTHQGLAAARRLSIASARGEFVAFLDHDDLWMPEKLERQVAAGADPSIALSFTDCEYVDERGRPFERLSDQYGLHDIDLTGTRGYAELLRRGCFVWQSTVVARTAVLRSVNSFDPAYPYIGDYDTWLQIARRYRIHYIPDVLAQWRVHDGQFTTRCPDVTLADHRKVLGALYRTATNPMPIRTALGDRLLGQHRVSCRALLRQKRYALALRAAAGMFSYPARLRAYVLGTLIESRIGPSLRRIHKPIRAVKRAFRRPPPEASSASPDPAHVWIDGSVLGERQSGYFNLVAELIRALAVRNSSVVHVTTSQSGRAALAARLGADVERVRFDRPRLRPRATPSRRWSARAIQWLMRVWTAPRGSPPHPNTVEVIVWRGRFRWLRSHRVAIVQDLTTRICPELHTPENVAEFEEYFRYVQRHAESVTTISEQSRRDIIARLPLFPDAVSIMPMALNPCYVDPTFARGIVAMHGITQPYVLCVGSIEPRKNLRRLVKAFELVADDDVAKGHLLAFVGPPGWDDGFDRFLRESDAWSRIRRIGFVPAEHLPSLYHFASAVVYPSLYEGFGLPVLEAMSASSIVIASATSALPEVLGDGITFDPYRTDAIAAALLRALSLSAPAAAEYRARCRARAAALRQRYAAMAPLPGFATASPVPVA